MTLTRRGSEEQPRKLDEAALKGVIEQFDKLRKAVQDATRACDRFRGRLDELNRQLKDRYGCETLEAAESLLAEMDEEILAKEDAFQKAAQELSEQYRAAVEGE